MSDPISRAKVEAGWLLAGGAAEDLPPSLDTLACSVSSPALEEPRTVSLPILTTDRSLGTGSICHAGRESVDRQRADPSCRLDPEGHHRRRARQACGRSARQGGQGEGVQVQGARYRCLSGFRETRVSSVCFRRA